MKIFSKLGVLLLSFMLVSSSALAAWTDAKSTGDPILASDWNAMVQSVWDNSNGNVYRPTGKVGIGTIAPNRSLQIADASGPAYLQMTSSTSGTTATDGLEFNVGTDASIWNYETGYLRLGTNNLERVRITSDGKVGIGTTAPGYKTDILGGSGENVFRAKSSNGNYVTIDSAGQFYAAYISGIGITPNASSGQLLVQSTADRSVLVVKGNASQTNNLQEWQDSNGNKLVVINSTGNVGIGTTSPVSKLHVSGGAVTLDNNNFFSGTRTDAVVAPMLGIYTDNYTSLKSSGSALGVKIVDTSNNALMTVLNGGYVGIGTTAPGYRLALNTATDYDGMVLQNNGVQVAKLGTYTSGTGIGYLALNDNANLKIYFTAASGSSSYLNNGGNFGIGTTVPGSKLEVVAADGTQTNLTINAYRDSSGGSILSLQHAKNTQASKVALTSGMESGSVRFLGYDGASFIRTAQIVSEVDGTPGTNDMPGRLAFYTTLDGTSTSTEKMRIDNAGNVGIGTTAPTSRLTIQQNSSSISGGLTFLSSDTGYGGGIYREDGQYGSLILRNQGVDTVYIKSGNVGIGTTAPSYRLHVPWLSGDAATTAYFGSSNANDNQIAVHGQSYSQVGVKGESSSNFGVQGISSSGTGLRGYSSSSYGITAYSGTSTAAWFNNNPATTNSAAVTMILERDTSGTAADGIGGAFDYYLEDDSGTANQAARIGALWTTAATATRTSALTFSTVNSAAAIAEAMRITGDGKVGIGTTSPGSALDFGAVNKFIGWGSNYRWGMNSSNVVSFDQGSLYPSGYRLNVSSSAGIFINSSGLVGIGTTLPQRKLSVQTTGDTYGVNIGDAGSATGKQLSLGYMLTSDFGRIDSYDYNTSAYKDLLLNGTGIVLKADGKVGIGTTAPGYQLDVAGSLNAQSLYINGAAFTVSNELITDTSASANTITLAPSPAKTSYDTSDTYYFKAANTSTGSSTVTISGMAAKTIKTSSGLNIVAGQIRAGGTYVLKYDGTNMILLNPSYGTSLLSGGGLKEYTTAGSYNFVQGVDCPPDVYTILVQAWGGGGSGGAGYYVNSAAYGAGGGGGGGYSSKWITLTAGQQVAVSVGAGGQASGYAQYSDAAYPGPQNGGTSSFGAYISAAGGAYGLQGWPANGSGGAGGAGSGGDTNITGTAGTSATTLPNSAGEAGGAGANGGAGGARYTAGTAPGGGGGGGTWASSGGAGAVGKVKVQW